jgi:hypothetical protein
MLLKEQEKEEMTHREIIVYKAWKEPKYHFAQLFPVILKPFLNNSQNDLLNTI